MTGVTIELARDGDLAEILRKFQRFWGDRELLRALHHPIFFREFADTAFVARKDGEIAGYLLGFVAPTGDGYIHFVAVRDDARTLGLGRRLYETFAAAAEQRGATALKALTSPENTGSMAFHRRMGFTDQTLAPDYAGSGRTRIVMRRPLPLTTGAEAAVAEAAGHFVAYRFYTAVARYQDAVAQDPLLAAAHAGLARALLALPWRNRRLEEAEAAVEAPCREAIRLDPTLVQAHVTLGEAAYRDWIRLAPHSDGARTGLASLLISQDRHEEAEVAYREWISLDPGNAQALTRLGDLRRSSGGTPRRRLHSAKRSGSTPTGTWRTSA